MYEGGCLCGAVRYRIEGRPLHATFCHCPSCRRATGAPFVAWATFPRESFSWQGGEPARFASSAGTHRTFCDRCGTSLTLGRSLAPEEIDVTIASLDEPSAVVPMDHTWTRHKLPWIAVRDALPCYPEARRRPE